MKLLQIAVAVILCCSLADIAMGAKRTQKATVNQTGITWQTSPESAAQAAQKKGTQPILWFRHVGELSGPMCSASHRTRVVSLADPAVQSELAGFVPMSSNMEGMTGAGRSVGHLPTDEPGLCPPRLAHQNCQILFLTPRLEVFHAATGFLPAEELVKEMQFAAHLFADIKKKPTSARQTVIDAHRKYLKQAGYAEQELAPPADGLQKMLAASGVSFPREGQTDISELFSGIARARILRDHQYFLEYPLISQAEFERDPTPLVGIADFTFQSGQASGRPTGK